MVELDGISPVIAGLAARSDDDCPLVAEVRSAAHAAVPRLLELLPSEHTPASERAG